MPDQTWLTSTPQSHTDYPIFCFPFAGGGASTYYPWESYFDNTHICICPVQLPGREGRLSESCQTNMYTLVDTLTTVIKPYVHQPFALFGHSMGAIIAFELARSLYTKWQVLPDHIFLSSRHAPHLDKKPSQRYLLPDDEIQKELLKLGGTHQDILNHPELMKVLLPVIRNDFKLFETYQYDDSLAPPLSCNVTILGGVEDQEVSIQDLLAWRALFTGALTSYLFPGGHFYFKQQLHAISEIIKAQCEADISIKHV
ncbi:thioesterase II family protein [Caldalkalibacillus salinus]|uniref:thioesterase II family protein n=1 Tax=Caldalkalibacillus salinus TaxID=2803787 RepID=UPI001923DFE7|nr:alpha/beta fold hydrolase [Caldalkalibacillus salinus]